MLQSIGQSLLYIYKYKIPPPPLFWAGVELRPLTGLLYHSWMVDDDDYGTTSGMNDLQG